MQRRLNRRSTFSSALLCLALGACGSEAPSDDTDDNRNEFIDNPSGPAAVAGAGGSGGLPNARVGSGGAHAGPSSSSSTSGSGGSSTSGGPPPLLCQPGSKQSCYSGPQGTAGVGICTGGEQSCEPDGMAWGPCLGEVVPKDEDCLTPSDENCDGLSPACAVIVDLRADSNRNGFVELTGVADDTNESTWNESQGAVLLANIDDDQELCPTSGSDSQLAACNDASDNVVNGSDDIKDLAPLATVPWPQAPMDASGSLLVDGQAAPYVRIFKKVGSSYSFYNPGSKLSYSEVSQGVEFAIEAKDFVRNTQLWNGYVDLSFIVSDSQGALGSDTLRMRVAPVIFRHHLDPLSIYYVTPFNSSSSTAFRNDLAAAASKALVDLKNVSANDQWTQDYFETAYMARPSASGKQVIHVNFRSANYTGGKLRSAGRSVFTQLRGKDVAGAVVYDSNHPDGMDTLNSFGNTETIPPYTHNGKTWAHGRVLRGSHPQFYPDQSFNSMVQAQQAQGLLTIDTSWLLVAHVDETVSFIKANSPRGWVLLFNDAAMAKSMLQQAQQQGYGATQMFVGKNWSNNTSAAVSINGVLADTDVMAESAWAVVKVDEQLKTIQAATGLANNELVPVPFLHQKTSGYSVAFNPGTVNGIYMSASVFATPDPHGPKVNGQDIFKQQLQAVLAPYGVSPHWVENWDLYHRLLGEVHCGSNATRQVPQNNPWWTASQ